MVPLQTNVKKNLIMLYRKYATRILIRTVILNLLSYLFTYTRFTKNLFETSHTHTKHLQKQLRFCKISFWYWIVSRHYNYSYITSQTLLVPCRYSLENVFLFCSGNTNWLTRQNCAHKTRPYHLWLQLKTLRTKLKLERLK